MLISDDGRRFAFDKRELTVLTGMMADPEARPTLAAMWLHPGKGQAWTTDGHRAVLVRRQPAPTRATVKAPVAVPASSVADVARTARGKDLVVFDVSGSTVSMDVRAPRTTGEIATFGQLDDQTRSKHTATCRRHAGGPASIEHLFPTPNRRGHKGAVVPVNVALLRPVVDLAKLATPGGRVWINLGRVSEPILLVAESDAWTTWRMLVMPLRAEVGEHPDHAKSSGEATEPAKPAKTRSPRKPGRRSKLRAAS